MVTHVNESITDKRTIHQQEENDGNDSDQQQAENLACVVIKKTLVMIVEEGENLGRAKV
jgi:hypothetical protein